MKKRDGTFRYAMVDDEDFEELNQYTWTHSYHDRDKNSERETVSRRVNGKKIYMSILLMNPPKGMEVDHWDRNGLNNQKTNLRICTHAENMLNKGKYKNNKTGFRGVQKAGKKFKAAISNSDKKLEYLGTYDTAIEAARVVNKRLYEKNPEFAVLNFPDEILKTNKK